MVAVQQFVAAHRVAAGEETSRVVIALIHGDHLDIVRRISQSCFEARAHVEIETGGEAECADADGRIIGELNGWLVHGIGDVLAHIVEAAVVIQHVAAFRIVEERVVWEIAMERIGEETGGRVARDPFASQIDRGNFAVSGYIDRLFRIRELDHAERHITDIMHEESIAENVLAIRIIRVGGDIPIAYLLS